MIAATVVDIIINKVCIFFAICADERCVSRSTKTTAFMNASSCSALLINTRDA